MMVETIGITMIGDTKAGASSLINRFLYDQFYEREYRSNISQCIWRSVVPITVCDVGLKFEIIHLYEIVCCYCISAKIVVLLFDITNRDSFLKIENWYRSLIELNDSNVSIVLVGTKMDLEEKRQISKEDADKLSRKLNIDYFEVSSKEGTNVKEAFENVISKAFVKRKNNYEQDKNAFLSINDAKDMKELPEKKYCW